MSPVMVPATDHAPVVRSFDPEDFVVPHGREEEWRFTPLDRLHELQLSPVITTRPVVSVNAVDAVTAQRLANEDGAQSLVPTPVDRIGASAWLLSDEVTVISVPAEEIINELIEVSIHTPTGTSVGHVVVDVGAFAQASVLVRFTGDGVFAGSISLNVGDSAKLTAATVYDTDRESVCAVRLHLRLGRDASGRSSVITLGGDVTRVHATVEYTGPGGDAELLGLFFANDGQHHEHRVFVDHSQPHCRSSVTYKGALEGQGTRTVWIGDVLVRANAIGIDTYEVNRNLVLSDGARADSVPNLELETGEIVGAGHASATGRFDDEQMFYLQSRGIPADLARVLVVRGFFAEILGRTMIPGLSESLMRQIDDRLGVGELLASVSGLSHGGLDDTEVNA